MNALPAAEVSDRSIPAKSFQYDANFFFYSEPAPGDALNVLDKLLGLFTPGFTLP